MKLRSDEDCEGLSDDEDAKVDICGTILESCDQKQDCTDNTQANSTIDTEVFIVLHVESVNSVDFEIG